MYRRVNVSGARDQFPKNHSNAELDAASVRIEEPRYDVYIATVAFEIA